ncbi:MAG: hypothetical protein K6L81_17425 [Agarilytica sp.]
MAGEASFAEDRTVFEYGGKSNNSERLLPSSRASVVVPGTAMEIVSRQARAQRDNRHRPSSGSLLNSQSIITVGERVIDFGPEGANQPLVNESQRFVFQAPASSTGVSQADNDRATSSVQSDLIDRRENIVLLRQKIAGMKK